MSETSDSNPSAPKRPRIDEGKIPAPKSDGRLPSAPCTGETFLSEPGLTDRQRLRWALRTEAEVRLAKLKSREPRTSFASDYKTNYDLEMNDVSEHSMKSDSLNHEMLIDLYPPTGAEKEPFIPKPDFKQLGKKEQSNVRVYLRDKENFNRKLSSLLGKCRGVDSSFSTLPELNVEVQESSFIPPSPVSLAAPPNLLMFEIILEGFMGYRVPAFHSNNPLLPRASVMGGAVLAALTAWQYGEAREILEDVESNKFLLAEEKFSYWHRRRNIVRKLNQFFHPKKEAEKESPFYAGDVDIFLQESPLKNKVFKTLAAAGIQGKTVQLIWSYCDTSMDSLGSFARHLCGEHLEPAVSEIGLKIVYAINARSLSFTCAQDDNIYSKQDPSSTWPRVSQLIMLDPRADLLGALLDFDISATALSYDGNTVRATPRAAFSILTTTQIVTPNILSEKRNRSRIIKVRNLCFVNYLLICII